MASVQMVHVHYKTIPLAITDLLGGQLQVMFTVGPAGLPQVKASRIRGLAVSTAKRSAFAPELPTVAESACRASTSSAGTASSSPPAPRVPSSRSCTRSSSPP
jgi:tripartite-type tricarboxylate transporter receptor subunit TctC